MQKLRNVLLLHFFKKAEQKVSLFLMISISLFTLYAIHRIGSSSPIALHKYGYE